MEGAHFHLLVNHIPIVGIIFGSLILLAGIILKNSTVKMTGLGTLIFASLSVSVVLFTGDPAGEAVQGLPGVSEAMVEHHESIAYSSLWILVPMGILAILAFYSLWKGERSGKVLSLVTFCLSVVAIAMMSWVGLTGGEIRHTEIRTQHQAILPAQPESSKDENDD